MIVDSLKDSILQIACEGKLVDQNDKYNANIEIEDILLDEKDNKKYVYKKISKEPFSIPKNWVWVKLEDICVKITDGTHSTPKYTNFGIPFISVKDVSGGYINFDNTKFISQEEHNKLFERCNPEYGDLLITKVGTTGVPAIINTTDQFSLFVSVALLKINTLKLNNKLLYYFLKSPIVQKQVKENTRGVGNKNWVLDAIKNTILPLPPLEEQQRIVDKIEFLFNKLDDISLIEEELMKSKVRFPEDMKNSILESAYSGKLTVRKSDDTPIEQILAEILCKRNELIKNKEIKKLKELPSIKKVPFEIPKTWKWVYLQELFNIRSAVRVHQSDWKKEGIPFYRAREISKLADFGYVDNELYISIDLYEKFKVNSGVPQKGDLMVSGVGTIGKTYIVTSEDKFYYKDASVICFENKYGLNAKYFKYMMDSPFMKKQINKGAMGTTVATITMDRAYSYLVPLPPLEEQQRIVDKLEQLLPLCDDVESLIVGE